MQGHAVKQLGKGPFRGYGGLQTGVVHLEGPLEYSVKVLSGSAFALYFGYVQGVDGAKHQAGHAIVGIHARKVQRKVLAWSRFRGFRARF
jgi:hypothetical protein